MFNSLFLLFCFESLSVVPEKKKKELGFLLHFVDLLPFSVPLFNSVYFFHIERIPQPSYFLFATML